MSFETNFKRKTYGDWSILKKLHKKRCVLKKISKKRAQNYGPKFIFSGDNKMHQAPFQCSTP